MRKPPAEIERVHGRTTASTASGRCTPQLGREGGVAGRPIARCTVDRLMKAAGLRGVSRVKTPAHHDPRPGPDRRPDLVERAFTAPAPNQLWVADITYIRTHSGWVYAAFVLDVFSRRIVGWQVSTNLHTDLALDALEMGDLDPPPRRRRPVTADPPLRPRRAIRRHPLHRTPRRSRRGRLRRIGGDSYDNAMAEAFNSLFKAELIRNKGPWKRHQRPRDRRRRVHRLVQPPPPARRARPDPTRRVRGPPRGPEPRPAARRGVRTQSPPNPALDTAPGCRCDG